MGVSAGEGRFRVRLYTIFRGASAPRFFASLFSPGQAIPWPEVVALFSGLLLSSTAFLFSPFVMKTFRFRRPALALMIACLFAGQADARSKTEPAPGPAARAVQTASAGGFSSYTLDNGFRIILAPFPNAASVRIELQVKTGSKLEGYGETGMAHLLEHMLFKSAGPRTDIKADLTRLGAVWNGTTSLDRTNYFEVVAADPLKVDEALRLEADRFIRASFTREHLASEMTVVRNELERGDSDPGSLIMRALQRQSYFWHGYGRPIIGARSDIEGAPFEALQAFHRRHYRPDNAALIVTGNFDPARVLALASQLFGVARNPAEPKPRAWTREEARPQTNRTELFMPAGKTIAASAWRVPGLTVRQGQALDLAVAAICDDDWGSLRKDLVLERKLAVSARCGAQLHAEAGLLVASATAGQEADAEALSMALWKHVEAAAQAGISEAQLARARQAELNAYERLQSNHEMLAEVLSQSEAAGDWRLFFWQRDVIRDLGLAEVNDALRQWVQGINRSDALLRHAEGLNAPSVPPVPTAASLVEGRTWPAFVRQGDPLPESAAELARLQQPVQLPGEDKAVLIARRTQGDLAWLTVANDYGDEAAWAGQRDACAVASELIGFGGAGMSRDALSARLESLKAHWSLGMGGLTLEAPREHLEAAAELLFSAWAAPALPEDEFARIKAAAIARLEAALKEPAQVAANAALLRFDNYPAGHVLKPRSLAAQLQAMQAVSYPQVKACVANLGGRGRLRLALVGDFKPTDLQRLAARAQGVPPSVIKYQRVRDLPPPGEVDVAPIEVAMPARPNASVSALAWLPLHDAASDFPALRIAVKILGGDAESRIWQRLREREGLAYGAGMILSGASFEPRSQIMLYASVASDKAVQAQKALADELGRALREGFSAAEVERARKAWAEERKTGLRSEKSFAASLAQGLLTGRDYAWLADYDARIATVTPAEVNAALRKYLGEAPLVWSIGRGL